MKTFADYLLDKPGLFTAEVRDVLEAYQEACHNYVLNDDGAKPTPIKQMRSTPPAKEPVSVEGEVKQSNLGASIVRLAWASFKPVDRGRVRMLADDRADWIKNAKALQKDNNELRGKM